MTLWCLHGYVDETRCELRLGPDGFLVGLRMGDELILEESHRDLRAAKARAGALRQRLVGRGWLERHPS